MPTADLSERTLPTFEPDPRPAIKLPEGRTLGVVTGLAQSKDEHLWVLHIVGPMDWDTPEGIASRLPPVVEFDAEGNFLQAWGGPDHLPAVDGRAQWPRQEETISIDDEDRLWIFGADKEYDHAVQRFSRDGRLLLRIGEFGVAGDDSSRDHLGCPTDAWHDVARREVFITDGYLNHRVAVFNSDTGAFLRAWGAYGKTPAPGSGLEAFNNPVHAISLGPDGYLYVSDRKNDRVQVFDAVGREEPRYVRELTIPVESPFGSVFNIAFSPTGDFMFISDGSNSRLWVVDRQAWQVVGSVMGPDSEGADLSATIHKIIADKDGNLLLGRCTRGVERMWAATPV